MESMEGNNKQLPEPDFEDIEDDEPCFNACENCDGHDACEDFGCAFELGLGHLVNHHTQHLKQ